MSEFDAANENEKKHENRHENRREKKHENRQEKHQESREEKMSASPQRDSALAELAALSENVERCRERLMALAESQRMATYDPKKPENMDGLLMAIYEAERGLTNAVRLLQRAARSR